MNLGGPNSRRRYPDQPDVPADAHGSYSGYTYYRCRCVICRAFMAHKKQIRTDRKRILAHQPFD